MVEQRLQPRELAMSQTLLEALHLVRRVGDDALLSDISVAMKAGDIMGLTGPSGSGKTVLLRALARLDAVDSGELRFHGAPVDAKEIPRFRSQVIYLDQRPSLMEGTVESCLQQPFELHVHRTRRYDAERIIGLLATLNRSASFLAKRQADLSGGEAQITCLLRAIQLDPLILLLDEPTSALDSESAQAVEATISAWVQEQPAERAVLWVTHDLQQAQRVCAPILTMHSGRIVEDN